MGESIHKLRGQTFILSPEKCIYWKEQRLLLLSDLHLGKAGHFRKFGVPVPSHVHLGDLKRLSTLINTYLPEQIIFLGDLFHSDYNIDWEYFCDWILDYDSLSFTLVKGNHDILYRLDYQEAGLNVIEELIIGDFSLTHEKKSNQLYNISGHIHPSVRLKGAARQGMTLPCFYFADDHGYLPAFGAFTGYANITPKERDKIYVIADKSVHKL